MLTLAKEIIAILEAEKISFPTKKNQLGKILQHYPTHSDQLPPSLQLLSAISYEFFALSQKKQLTLTSDDQLPDEKYMIKKAAH